MAKRKRIIRRPTVPKFTEESFADETAEMLGDLFKKESKAVFEVFVKGGNKQDLIDRFVGLKGTASNYTATYVDTGLSIVGRKRMGEVAEDLGLTNFKYIGGVIKTTRDFCDERNGNIYTKEEVESWADEEWDGKIDDTDSENIFDYCGGWNCRHQLVPVLK